MDLAIAMVFSIILWVVLTFTNLSIECKGRGSAILVISIVLGVSIAALLAMRGS